MKLPFSKNESSGNQRADEGSEPYRQIGVAEAKSLIDAGQTQVIDVREPWEYASGHLPGARLVPINTFLRQPSQYLTQDNVMFVCASGERSSVACEMAAALGFKQVYNVAGGTNAWRAKGFPIEK